MWQQDTNRSSEHRSISKTKRNINKLQATTNMTARLYKQNGEEVAIRPENGENFSLTELQGYVGGLIEIINLSSDQIMVVNEEGKFDKTLRPNTTATIIARINRAIVGGDYIAGDAIICNDDMVK